jgi:predicted DNA-binding transcriptional regulator AlpA
MYKHESEIPLVLSVKDVEMMLGIGQTSAYELMNSSQFHVVKVGKQLKVYKSVFLKWLTNEDGTA